MSPGGLGARAGPGGRVFPGRWRRPDRRSGSPVRWVAYRSEDPLPGPRWDARRSEAGQARGLPIQHVTLEEAVRKAAVSGYLPPRHQRTVLDHRRCQERWPFSRRHCPVDVPLGPSSRQDSSCCPSAPDQSTPRPQAPGKTRLHPAASALVRPLDPHGRARRRPAEAARAIAPV